MNNATSPICTTVCGGDWTTVALRLQVAELALDRIRSGERLAVDRIEAGEHLVDLGDSRRLTRHAVDGCGAERRPAVGGHARTEPHERSEHDRRGGERGQGASAGHGSKGRAVASPSGRQPGDQPRRGHRPAAMGGRRAVLAVGHDPPTRGRPRLRMAAAERLPRVGDRLARGGARVRHRRRSARRRQSA